MAAGSRSLVGVMLESFLEEGRQDVRPGEAPTFGQSITDACLGWPDSAAVLATLAEGVRKRRG